MKKQPKRRIAALLALVLVALLAMPMTANAADWSTVQWTKVNEQKSSYDVGDVDYVIIKQSNSVMIWYKNAADKPSSLTEVKNLLTDAGENLNALGYAYLFTGSSKFDPRGRHVESYKVGNKNPDGNSLGQYQVDDGKVKVFDGNQPSWRKVSHIVYGKRPVETITNVTVIKSVIGDGADPLTSFPFKITNLDKNSDVATFSLTDDGNQVVSLPAGNYKITETIEDVNYSLTGMLASTGISLVKVANENAYTFTIPEKLKKGVTITVTNTYTAPTPDPDPITVIVKKVVVGDGASETEFFPFTLDGDSNERFFLMDGDTETLTLEPGDYTLTEGLINDTDYTMTSVETDNDAIALNIRANGADFTLTNELRGKTVTITVTNTYTAPEVPAAKIEVVKKMTEPQLSPPPDFQFQLTDAESNLVGSEYVPVSEGADNAVTIATITEAGTYSLEEILGADSPYELVDMKVDGQSILNTENDKYEVAFTSEDITAGKVITVVATNRVIEDEVNGATIRVVKKLQDGTEALSFSFELRNPDQSVLVTKSVPVSFETDNPVTLAKVTQDGSYTLVELLGDSSAYELVDMQIEGTSILVSGTNTGIVAVTPEDIEAGADITVYVTNKETEFVDPYTLQKVVENAPAGDTTQYEFRIFEINAETGEAIADGRVVTRSLANGGKIALSDIFAEIVTANETDPLNATVRIEENTAALPLNYSYVGTTVATPEGTMNTNLVHYTSDMVPAAVVVTNRYTAPVIIDTPPPFIPVIINTPVEIPEVEVPQAEIEIPEDFEVLPEEIPLAELPKTGTQSAAGMAIAAILMLAAAALVILPRARRNQA